MDLQEMGCGGYGLDQAGLGQGQVAGICECGNEPSRVQGFGGETRGKGTTWETQAQMGG